MSNSMDRGTIDCIFYNHGVAGDSVQFCIIFATGSDEFHSCNSNGRFSSMMVRTITRLEIDYNGSFEIDDMKVPRSTFCYERDYKSEQC